MDEREITLKVANSTDPEKLAGAIYRYILEGAQVKASVWGEHAIPTCMRASEIASDFFENQKLYMTVETGTTLSDHQVIRTYLFTYTLR